MAKLKSRVPLDSKLLDLAAKYYKIDRKELDRYQNWECFSHPSLELHDCNVYAKLAGGFSCAYCQHVPGRPCDVSCDFQTFCLAMFAFRMGLGGETIVDAVENNLYKMDRKALYESVISKLATEDCGVESMPPSPVVEKAVFPDDKVSSELNTEDSMDEKKDLMTIAEAAEWYGCSYPNIHHAVKTGVLPSVKEGKKTYIKLVDLEAYRVRPRSRKKNAGVETSEE